MNDDLLFFPVFAPLPALRPLPPVPVWEPTLRVLLSNPYNDGPAVSRLAAATVYDAVDGLRRRTHFGTLDALTKAVTDPACVAVHVDAHVRYSGTGSAYLLLEDPSGAGAALPAARLLRLLNVRKLRGFYAGSVVVAPPPVELAVFAGSSTESLFATGECRVPHVVALKADMAFNRVASDLFMLAFYRRVFAGQAVAEAFDKAQAAAGVSQYVLISTADAPATLTCLREGASAAATAAAATLTGQRRMCPSNVVDGAACGAVACDGALSDVCSRSTRVVPRLVPVADKFGQAGRDVAAYLCQQALNRSQGSDGDAYAGYLGGVYYEDIGDVATDALHATLTPYTAKDVGNSKFRLLVLSGCEHHPDELLKALFMSLLTTKPGLILCAVGTSVCL